MPSADSPDPEIRLRTVSVVDAAADALRQMVLDGTLEPGARLRETDFSKRLGIARHTFRAATQILINEGLLRRSPNRGVQLTILDGADIIDIFRLREALELEAIRLVISDKKPIPDAERAVERFNALGDEASWRDRRRPRHGLPPRRHRRRRAARASTAPTPESSRKSCSAWPSFAPTTTVPPRSQPSIVSCSRRSRRAT